MLCIVRPDTLPRSYVTWYAPFGLAWVAHALTERSHSRINQAGKIPAEGVSMNRDLVRDGFFKLEDLERVLERNVRSLHFSEPLLSITFPLPHILFLASERVLTGCT